MAEDRMKLVIFTLDVNRHIFISVDHASFLTIIDVFNTYILSFKTICLIKHVRLAERVFLSFILVVYAQPGGREVSK